MKSVPMYETGRDEVVGRPAVDEKDGWTIIQRSPNSKEREADAARAG
jgi:hypothetical protein